jgi:ATP-dependent helicase HrpB
MTPLPIDPFLPQITEMLREAGNLVLVAEPGAGKTTRVPPAIFRAGMLSNEHPNLVMLQPRRVTARAAARRIAEENGWEVGGEVGYHVRFDRRISRATRIRVVTEGILTRQLLDDPFLEGIGAVLLDEFHERSIHTDIAIALLREVQQSVRADLKLVVMSATLEAGPVAKFLGNCPVVNVPGRTFPVDVSHSAPSSEMLEVRVRNAVHAALKQEGDMLVFLPGAEEIRRAQREIGGLKDVLVLPLHGSLPAEEQDRALRPAPAGMRKIILSTNIAETSLTIDGVRVVIDSGLARVPHYDAERGIDRLDLQRISKASATQRAGRAGRTAAGRCVRLWTAKEDAALEAFDLPEIRRVDLASTVLALHAWGRPDVRGFNWYEAPDERALAAGEELLELIGAVRKTKSGFEITALGKRINALPVHPRLGRLMLAAADAGLGREGATLAALLAEKDILFGDRNRPAVQGDSDLLYRLHLLESRDRSLDPVAIAPVLRLRDELARLSNADCRLPNSSFDIRQSAFGINQLLLRCLLLAYPDRVSRRRETDPNTAIGVNGVGLRMSPDSVVKQGEFFLAIDTRKDDRMSKGESLVRQASKIEPAWLEELFPQLIRRERGTFYDAKSDRVAGIARTIFLDLVIQETRGGAVDEDQAAEALGKAVLPEMEELVTRDEAAGAILARVELLRRHMPEMEWPDLRIAISDLQFAMRVARGKRSLAEVRNSPLAPQVMELLPYPFDRQLAQHAPETIEVPTGNRIRVQYSMTQAPVLAVRLQELFGMVDTPRIAGGRVAVVLHLLSPGYKPVQVTQDLRSFWTNTYPQVRKDLRSRYPKHAWPEDPLSAKPVAKGRATK